MNLTSILLLAASTLTVGLLVGCVGVGGVLVPPALAQFGGMNLQLVMATSMCSFPFAGLAGSGRHVRLLQDWERRLEDRIRPL